MRIGQNPIKSMDSIAPPSKVTLVVISSIPFLAGYYQQSLDVLKRCINSIYSDERTDFDLLVFDNGSCQEVRNFLTTEHEDGRIQYLMLSTRNIGKAGAWNMALAAAPGETIIYADSDVIFYSGWLKAHLDVLEAFPEAGMVTGMPILTPEKNSTGTLAWAQKTRAVKTERGNLIEWEDFWRHSRTLGDDETDARKFYEENKSVKITYKQEEVFIGAAHFQFATRKKILEEILPIEAGRPMGRVRLLDEAMNKKGYLRLCTMQWYVEHVGNTLPENDAMGNVERQSTKSTFWQKGLFRKILQWLYNRIFNLLYRD